MNDTVLIIADDPLILSHVERELKRNFLDAICAATGRGGLLHISKADMVLLDVKLPDMDGLEVLSKIKQERPDCEVIVITGYGTQEVGVQALMRGAIDYIQKPLNLQELGAALGRAQEKIAERRKLAYENSILVIDDQKEVVERLSDFLEKEGYQTFEAYSGKEGLDIIAKNKIDVVISDIKMEQIDGIEVIKQAKKLCPGIEAIMITGYGEEELAVKSLRAGAFDYLRKPLNLDEVLWSVEKAIERIKLSRSSLYRNRELKLSTEIVARMNEELERTIAERTLKLTELDMAHKELRSTQEELVQSEKLASVGRLAAGVAHEINNPLASILLGAQRMGEMIKKQASAIPDSKAYAGILERVERATRRCSKIVGGLLTFARPTVLEFRPLDVNKLVTESLESQADMMETQNIKVIEEFAADMPMIEADEEHLIQVLSNLLVNACEAMPNGGQLKIITRLQRPEAGAGDEASREVGEAIEIQIGDTGKGISKEDMLRIFDPFFTTKKTGNGVGLGLSIAYGILRSHGGSISVRSEKGEGTTFVVNLPAKT